jgi:predicted regulator of Ras-like GTPase activity (Roadblock/LC7/MglB family)
MTHAYGIEETVGRSTRLDRVLTELVAQVPEIEAASVVSFDGLPMAAALPDGMDEDRVAAMSAALLSLGERAAEGLGRGLLSQVYVEGENGTVFLVSADDEAVLVAVAAKGAKVGLMLFEVRRAASAVADVLRVDPIDTGSPPAPVEVVAPVAPVAVAAAVEPVPDLESRFEQPAYGDDSPPASAEPERWEPVSVEPECTDEPFLTAVPEPVYTPAVEAYEPLATPLQPVSSASPSSASWYAAETILPGAGTGVTDASNWG